MLKWRWLPLLLLALPLGARADDAAFRAIVVDSAASLGDRKEAVSVVSEQGTADAVASMLWAVAAIDQKLDGQYDERERLAREYAPYNTDKLTDAEWKKKEELDVRIAKQERLILDHEGVLAVLLREFGTQTSEAALAELGSSRSLRSSNWRARAYAAAAIAGNPDAPADGAARLLGDSDPRVRGFVAEGFGRRKDKAYVRVLGPMAVKDDAWQVRATVVDALQAIGSQKAVRFLIEALGKESGRLLEDVNRALKKLTGQNFQPDYPAWKNWYEENKAAIEGDEEVKGPANEPRWRKKDGASIYGVQTYSKRMVFILDISDSMNDPLGQPGAVTGGDEDEGFSGPKIDMAKRELKRTIRLFDKDAFFNVIAFNHIVQTWKPKMMPATQKVKNEAYVWIRALKAEASTYLYGALKTAFEMAGMGANDPHYSPDVDTILLLSDGAPTDNTMAAERMDTEFILEAVRAWNKLSKITVHVIAIDEAAHGDKSIKFLKDLARENNGTYIAK